MSDDTKRTTDQPRPDQMAETRRAIRAYLNRDPEGYDMPEHILAGYSVRGLIVLLTEFATGLGRRAEVGDPSEYRFRKYVATVQDEIHDRFRALTVDVAAEMRALIEESGR